jgi:glycerol-3-phosphate dehydrogenase subunit C
MKKTETEFEAIIRSVIDACADCDTCRFLMNEDCLFFPELYRLVDQEKESGQTAGDLELKRLVELCTLCGLCPCPNIRNDVIRAKTAFVRQNGMPIGNRMLADVQQFGRTCGMMPGLINGTLSIDPVKGGVKRITGIHPKRKLPQIPGTNFFDWAKDRGLCRNSANGHGVAYFAGCTAGYLFPEVGRATVKILELNDVKVFVPPQQCCGMPTLVEGDIRTTLKRARSNLDSILAAKDRGFEPVSSCPTCGFLMKVLLKEGAYHSESYQKEIGAGPDEIIIPDEGRNGKFSHLKKSIYGEILKDDGLFNALDPLNRINVSDGFSDIGKYLLRLLDEKKLYVRFHNISKRIVYFAPCHQREQNIGSPYLRLLSLIPGLNIQQIGGSMDCCGMGGSLGYKKGFHDASVSLGAKITDKVGAHVPDAVVTDCLSCRLQFQHLLPFPVYHPLEILISAYTESGAKNLCF